MDLAVQLHQLCRKNLPESPLSDGTPYDKEAFIKVLSPYVRNLLDNNFSKLLEIMYRIDVPEKEFALTLELDQTETPEYRIASLIYDRMLLKVKTRAEFKKGNA